MFAFPFHRVFLFLFGFSLSVFCHAQVVTEKPETQVDTVLLCDASFTDAMYEMMDWQTFVNSDLAKKPIDYHKIDYHLLNAAVFYYTNKFRESRHLTAFVFSPQLRNAAEFHSIDMVNHRFYAHINPKLPSMRNPSLRVHYFKFQSETVGENIAQQFLLDYKSGEGFNAQGTGDQLNYHFTDGKKNGSVMPPLTYGSFADQIVKQWIASPPHRDNMLDKSYTYMGCGIFASRFSMTKNGIPYAYGTQDFGGTE
jgi:uncharacterized protein YkwD